MKTTMKYLNVKNVVKYIVEKHFKENTKKSVAKLKMC